MKKIIVLLIACFAAWYSTKAAGDEAGGNTPPTGVITFQTFYDELSPYGHWIDFPGYGYVWRPDLGSGFSPYLSNGYWVSTNEGWFWNSGYRWGWAPFHYGSWLYDGAYGWLWVPDYVWAPAWVNWGYTEGYYGWAPVMPGIAQGGTYYGYRPTHVYWNYVPCGHITDRQLYRATVNRTQVNNYVRKTTIINNYGTTREKGRRFNSGPELTQVEKFTRKKIQPLNVTEQGSAGATRLKGNSVTAYRPGVSRADAQPRSITKYNRSGKIEGRTNAPAKDRKIQGNTPAAPRTNTQVEKDRRMSPSTAPARDKQQKISPSSSPRESRPQYDRPLRPANENPKSQRMQPAQPAPAQPAQRPASPPKRDKMSGGGS